MTTDSYRLTSVRARRRLRLQDPAGRAGGRRRRACWRRPATRPASCWSASTTVTTRPWSGSPTAPAVVATADFFTPVVDDPYDWGRIAAANALSDVYAMGGAPGRRGQPAGLAAGRAADRARRARCCAAAWTSARAAGCHVAGGHSVDDPEPKYGMAVTGVADPDRLLRNDAGRRRAAADAHQAARHRRAEQPAQGDRRACSRRRSTTMTTLNRAAARGGPRGRRRAAPPTSPASGCSATCYKLARASGVTAVVDAAAVPYLDGAREALRDGYVSGGTRRNLDWVRPHLDVRRRRRGRAAAARRRPDLRRPAGGRRGARLPGHRRAGARAGRAHRRRPLSC